MNTISELLSNQRAFFKSQKTKNIAYRINILKQLKAEIEANEQAVYAALKADFNKSEFETFISEFGLVLSELNLVINNLKRWIKPKRVKSSMLTFPSKSYIYKEPYGAVLVIAPWNYPFLLAIEPLIMAIAAGNTVIVKPSELTKNTSQLIANIIDKVFPENLATTIQGGVDVTSELLEQKWDYIFFTGSIPVGKIVAKAAAKHLTPVTLELGGKSPCIIDDTVDVKLIARRLTWGKFLNAGQTCIAPDYLIVKASVKLQLIEALKIEITKQYGDNPEKSPDFPRVINNKNLLRLENMLEGANIIFGGTINKKSRYCAPTLIDEPDLTSNIMQDEIFGPILPILSYNNKNDIETIIWNFEKPLALYIFSNTKPFIKQILNKYSFGGGAINDSLIHFGNHRLPFGGVGASGMGVYHGKHGFDTFSHNKAIIKRDNWADPSIRYAPYKGKLNLIKKVFKLFS
ncbi:aldehyde dehydrogenase [Sabulilitoribacter arenilitoris]|uniref:Aldehyde dehydrogenase n=1 Tax=Wocania arenilitoris TaxID=2044858 RepID=A0AAE3EP76_9FLAO|nr:aldehyde dehydrogenase [Wocania arenilitoris]MCF7568007.1 aldehyde dehydrogenase [Wocania arenilitoris]